eukprot:7377338-Prymnesium_polylepis.1
MPLRSIAQIHFRHSTASKRSSCGTGAESTHRAPAANAMVRNEWPVGPGRRCAQRERLGCDEVRPCQSHGPRMPSASWPSSHPPTQPRPPGRHPPTASDPRDRTA